MSDDNDLFAQATKGERFTEMPLAKRMAPRSLSEFAGQEHIVGPGKLLRRAIEADRVLSVIFSGDPGTGKTALANVIASQTNSEFVTLNAVHAKVADIRAVVEKAKQTRSMYGKKTTLFIDEIHRFSKTQQDALLPDVEAGVITLIGATTENPYFSIIPALVSRSQVFEFKALSNDDLKKLIYNALTDERGLKSYRIEMDADAVDHLIAMAGGDARKVLNGLELAAVTTAPSRDGIVRIDRNIIEESIQKKKVVYAEDQHYDVISAFIKSMRGTDPDAALYWLAKMIYAGEDPRFIARRIIICASEDVGNADPQALVVATSALQAVSEIGMPEGRIILAQAAVYVACAPKSNASYKAIGAAMADIESGLDLPVPLHLQNAVYDGEKKAGKGREYIYPHDEKFGYVTQDYLPQKRSYYVPVDRGYEKKIREWLTFLKKN